MSILFFKLSNLNNEGIVQDGKDELAQINIFSKIIK